MLTHLKETWGTSTTTIRLPRDLYKAMNHLAVDEDVSVLSLIQKAIENLLKAKGKKWEG